MRTVSTLFWCLIAAAICSIVTAPAIAQNSDKDYNELSLTDLMDEIEAIKGDMEEYEEELKSTMFKAYEHVLGFNYNCKIEKES